MGLLHTNHCSTIWDVLGRPEALHFGTYVVPLENWPFGFQVIKNPLSHWLRGLFYGCGDRVWTYDLQVM